uniref:Vta1 domain-containing protein n=1 Tax=Heterorhabditis bacteriophora TaxID=37862 RepID=A0A1I7WS99_HETBA
MSTKVPASLKPISHYIKIANENANRDPVVYYWCLFYAVQCAMQLDKNSPEALQFLTGLLGTLESVKKQLSGTEAINNEIIAQAHLESFALKLFDFADAKEKAGQIDKSVVHAFYTAGHVMDVLSLFGEHSLKNLLYTSKTFVLGNLAEHNHPNSSMENTSIPPTHTFGERKSAEIGYNTSLIQDPSGSKQKPTVEAFNEARKFTKYALSAIDYEDTNAVVDNLKKALAFMENF